MAKAIVRLRKIRCQFQGFGRRLLSLRHCFFAGGKPVVAKHCVAIRAPGVGEGVIRIEGKRPFEAFQSSGNRQAAFV